MPLFMYTALRGGREHHGSLDALSLQEAREALKQAGYDVQEIHEATAGERKAIPPWERGVVEHQEEKPIQREVSKPVESMVLENVSAYSPNAFISVLRIYAGWLLAWYALVFILGTYQLTKRLPIEFPYVDSLVQSPLLPRFAFGVFLFLLLSSLHQAWYGGIIKGTLLTAVGVGLLWGFHLHV
ncbi:hypothetical protein COU77_00910 [Candidatus Peregrinibacteria bacterium CG10_big_fil_rev_8_21_14_0_10_49_16]|nr:MAG: hypothetical protein COU77_00910 [Candidatus Peregrinibacteria bacterium CG10_big_fil_rev_8_21_14_0_10_49_16]